MDLTLFAGNLTNTINVMRVRKEQGTMAVCNKGLRKIASAEAGFKMSFRQRRARRQDEKLKAGISIRTVSVETLYRDPCSSEKRGWWGAQHITHSLVIC